MRVLYSHRVQSRDGQGVHIEELVTAFRNAGHEVLVAGPSLYERADFGGESRLLPVIRGLLPKVITELAEILYNIPATTRLQRAYKNFAPQFIYERYNLFYLAGMLLKWWHRVPFYLEINSPLAEERIRYGGLALPRLARAMERRVWRSADRVFVVTDALKGLVVAAGVTAEKVTVMPNGVDLDAFAGEPYQAGRSRAVTIGFVGFIRDWHGLDAVIDLLAGASDGPTIKLVVAGEGPARPVLEQQAAALGIQERVRFVGLVPRQSIPALIGEFDIALQPRVVAYASPLKIFEYMACGRAIIAPDQPNIREILSDGETAILFEPANHTALWNAIQHLAGDPELRERLGRAARRSLETREYTWQGNAAKILAMAADDCRRAAGAVRAPAKHAATP
jgi:glycosyltransferase involved in cell wall biosynthesis